MKLKDATPFGVIIEAWERLPEIENTKGQAIVFLDKRSGKVRTAYDYEEFYEHEDIIFVLNNRNKDEARERWQTETGSIIIGSVQNIYRKFKNEIRSRITKLKEKHPHLA